MVRVVDQDNEAVDGALVTLKYTEPGNIDVFTWSGTTATFNFKGYRDALEAGCGVGNTDGVTDAKCWNNAADGTYEVKVTDISMPDCAPSFDATADPGLRFGFPLSR